MNVISTIRQRLENCINENKIFTYDGSHIKAIAFVQGFKHEKLNELKNLIKNKGFEYNFDLGCYTYNDCDGDCKDKYRGERDEFIDNLISWKIGIVK
jgi:hypothetical protein